MPLQTDLLIDRNNLKKKLFFWKNFFILSVIIFLLIVLLENKKNSPIVQDHIARVEINGMILYNKKIIELIDSIKNDQKVKAVILSINSPGGTVIGGESLYKAISSLKETKPVVTVMYDLATSAAYMTAVPSDHIIAYNGTITGSIGVIVHQVNVNKLMDKIGVNVNEYTSGDLKAQPSSFNPVTEKSKKVMNEGINEFFNYFIDIVKKHRNLTEDNIKIISDGRIFIGNQALNIGLIDQIGDEKNAIEWLSKNKDIKTTKIIDYFIKNNKFNLQDFIKNFMNQKSNYSSYSLMSIFNNR